jgi:hypothetical protein
MPKFLLGLILLFWGCQQKNPTPQKPIKPEIQKETPKAVEEDPFIGMRNYTKAGNYYLLKSVNASEFNLHWGNTNIK